jgi:diaminohydroxyphosphoribosylaminopyrimidine deaminase/5-amino-6-(5-phosphoribosylamino)uracil reductase
VDAEALMQEALDLAVRGRGEVEPNPRVGALALQRGEIVGRGWHQAWGAPHAEIEALADARARGATPDAMVITLEPCSSEAGDRGKKTPPCTRALLDAGIQRVILGAGDPDPRHRGKAIALLEQAGVDVQDGVLASRCRALNRPFERWLQLDRPWTIAKWAMTLDGKTATATGESRWISSFESRRKTHELRARVDAVVVGFRTARIDDPELTVRHATGPQPIRIVVDPFAEIDDDSRLVASARVHPTWLITSTEADARRTGHLQDLGVQVLHAKPAEKGRRLQLREAWRELRRRGIQRLMVEGGGGLLAQLLAWECVDQVLCFLAPKIVGGQGAPTPVGGAGRAFMAEAWRLQELHWSACGEDLAVGGFVG